MDIVIETRPGIHPVVIGIEVTDRQRPADTPWIESIAQKHADLPLNKTIVVSRSGFCRTALQKAKTLKMDALTLGDAARPKLSEDDWLGALEKAFKPR